MNSPHSWHERALESLDGIGLLALRLWVGQEFLQAGYTKLSGGVHAPQWFAALDFPFPLDWLSADLNWLAAGVGELTLSAAIILGVFSRFAALGLLFITYVAVYTVHFDLGWSGWHQIETDAGQGFKVPLMMAVMLAAILTQGGGKYAIDTLLAGRRRRPTDPAHQT